MNADPKLKIELKGETEVVFTRYFDAPRKLVFDCHTKPELMRRWLGSEGMVLEICEVDLKVGGKYLFVYAAAEGKKFGVYGSFRKVVVPEIVANTENYAMDMTTFDPNAPEDPNAFVETRTFTAQGNGTLMTHVCQFASAEARKEILESGMVEGWEENYQGLEKLLSTLA
ncbi:ATPase [Leptospira langatensis]|uniref:ATPase n=1 Tax=Leptospira langatensis TaxID=2484983 RepID=A0A5F1ZZ50_9LEPT|nr:SRPBCC domain-containing protein [Leptospira langatensis]TGJ98363.1 ATPase [Leptospira langatensis]TGL43277.1 ATPase [Leptospira langatensis]